MQDLAATLAAQDINMQDLAAALAAQKLALRQTLRSTSWQIGAPIRSIGRSFPRLRIVGRQFARMVWWFVTLRLYQELVPRVRARVHLSRGFRTVEKSGLFDSDWYLAKYPDVAEAGINPLLHYMIAGADEGRDPGPTFDSQAYLKANPDVAASGFNPLMHYLLYGRDEGRCLSLDGLSFMSARNDYVEWVRRYDRLGDAERAALRAAVTELAKAPLISVVMPVYNPRPAWLIAAIESVRRQIYPHWQLCIADDASSDAAIRPILERYAREDERITVVFREQNGHISAASNSALDLAEGEWVALLDHDDLLAEAALFWVADAVGRHPEARLIYSDEDKIDDKGRRCDPYFKCDWNIDLFYSHNLITHLGVYHAALVREIGGFREGFEGAQDYDLALRCIERLGPGAIHHIPRVLYHWRVHGESTAQAAAAKPYAMRAGERALNEHLRRCGVAAHAELIGHGYRIHYDLPEAPPRVSLIIPTRNGMPLIRKCVASILEKTTYPNYEILIIDNGSDDPDTLRYFEEMAREARVRVIRDDRPFNFSALNNAAVQKAEGVVVGLINDDIEVIAPDWLGEMVSLALQPGIGAVGARLLYPNGTLQHGGIVLGLGGLAAHAHRKAGRHGHGYCARASLIQSFSAVTAACLVIRKAIYEEVGGLNETHLQVAYNDVDFCLRVREVGYRNVWTPYAELYHHESATRGQEDTPEKQARFAREAAYIRQHWGHILLNDPAYSPNLTLDHEDFSLAWPPRVEVKPSRSSLDSQAPCEPVSIIQKPSARNSCA
jgi:glycosyltransferase involved in cell wall biosynthesis